MLSDGRKQLDHGRKGQVTLMTFGSIGLMMDLDISNFFKYTSDSSQFSRYIEFLSGDIA